MEVLFIIAAYLFGLLAKSLKLPPLVGYLFAGFALSVSGYLPTDNLKSIADLGVTLLLFTVGLKIKLRNILSKEIIGGGFLYMLLSTILFSSIGYLVGFNLAGSIYFGIMLSFSSTVFAAKVLDDHDDLGSYYGRIAIGILILQDIVAVALLGVSGMEKPSIWALSIFALPLLMPIFKKLLERTGHGELLLIFGISLALSGSWLFGLMGLSDKLGALVFGIFLAQHQKAEELGKVLWGLKEAFLVAFFLNIGLLGLPDKNAMLLVGLFLVLLPLKGLIYFFVLKLFKLRNRTAFWSSSVLFCYSEFGLIAAAGAVAAGLLSENILVMLAMLVASSFILLGILNKYMSDIYDKFFAFLDKSTVHTKQPDHLPSCIGNTKFLVVGMGTCGTSTYDYLKKNGQSVIGIDADPNVISEHRKNGRRVIYGNAIDKAFWEKCDLQNLHGVSICLPVMDEKLTVIKKLRNLGYKNKLDTYCYFEDEAELLKKAGVSNIVSPLELTGEGLGMLVVDDRVSEPVA